MARSIEQSQSTSQALLSVAAGQSRASLLDLHNVLKQDIVSISGSLPSLFSIIDG
jgi:hypothetical protein